MKQFDSQYIDWIVAKFYFAVDNSDMKWIEVGKIMGYSNPREVYRYSKYRQRLKRNYGPITDSRVRNFIDYIKLNS